MFCNRDGIATRRVHDDDAARGCLRDIDVVHANSSAADHFQIWGRIENIRRYLDGATDEDALRVGEMLASHYPNYIDPEADKRIRDRFPIRLHLSAIKINRLLVAKINLERSEVEQVDQTAAVVIHCRVETRLALRETKGRTECRKVK